MDAELSPEDAVEALIREGVPEEVARYEARTTASMLILYEEPEASEPWED